jgi:D-cysteine desulfhydrase
MNNPPLSEPGLVPAAGQVPRKSPGKIALFRYYPRLEDGLPYVSLGLFPTLVEKLDRVGNAIGLPGLYAKRDDLSGSPYGGNKVRKLEFLLGGALRAKAREVITFGFAGSNHALATAVYAKQLGLASTSMLLPQVNSQYLRRNLLASHHFGAELHLYRNRAALSFALLCKLLRGKMKRGAFARIIPAGGSCPLGVVGYVNAVLELKEQILAGEMPEPDRVYVPMGSMGTSVGLALGLKVAGLKSQVIAVRVIGEQFANAAKAALLFDQTARFLNKLDPAFRRLSLSEDALIVRGDCIGEGYAHFTRQGVEAAELMKKEAGIILNGTYSAKAFSALVLDAQSQALRGKTVLFWNTYNSRDLSGITAAIDYHDLPGEFHRYFQEDVQSLDKTDLDR